MAKKLEVTIVDFESEGINRRPQYPPIPVGFSIKRPGDRRSTYWAWGHPTENNCTREQARRVLRDAWRGPYPLGFHHAKFDVDVACTHLDLPMLPWERTHDTKFLLALDNPYADSFSLKPSAERILGMKPEERDILREWIIKNVPEARRKPSEWGRYICRAPGRLVGAYADGDVIRTDRLLQKLYADIVRRGMLQAYDRERRLMPILLENERNGIKLDVPLLERDLKVYEAALAKADDWLRKRLGAPGMNVDSDRELAKALKASGVVRKFRVTEYGNDSVSKKNLTGDMFTDPKVHSVLGYRNILSTCIGTFMRPWLEMAHRTGGTVHTEWNQVRSERGQQTVGARTGRLSSTPNFQNVPKNWKKAKAEGYVYPKFLRVPDLPLMRRYFLPDSRRHLWGRRDFNQQELRLLAHFEDGDLMRRYNEEPRLDVHQLVKEGFLDIAGLDLDRDYVKVLNFGEIYGMGLGEMASRIHQTVAVCQRLKRAKRELLPDYAQLMDDVKNRGKAGLPIRTWGGREYYTEPGRYVKKYRRYMTFEYKLLNYLIQGSGSDVFKESVIRYHDHPKAGPNTGDARWLVGVHDENDISVARGAMRREMQVLREVMQSVEMDVPMLSDGEYGPNWAELQALKERA